MNGNWSAKWKNALIWFSSYTNFIAFVLLGGYVILKNDDESLKKTTKTAFIVTLIFACISAFLSVFYNFASMSDSYYSSATSDFYDIASKLVSVAKIVTYAVFIILEFVKKEQNGKTEQKESAEQ